MSGKYSKAIDNIFWPILFSAIFIGLVDIYVHVKWWISWSTFFTTVGTFCAFGVLTFISGIILTHEPFLPKWDDGADKALIVFGESVFMGFFSIPLWYLYAHNSEFSNFWSVLMPAVCVGIPFVSNIVISKKVISALAMDRAANMQAENVWKRKLEKWEEFRLGIDGIAKFKSIVECRRQEMNIRYAKKACMRQIVPSKVVFAITDSYVEESTLSVSSRSYVDKCFEVYMERGFFDDLNWSKWRFDLDRPMSSFGAFVTEIKYQGKSYCVGIKISEVGDILLCMDGKGIKYLEKEFKSWDEMLKFLDNKIGIEA